MLGRDGELAVLVDALEAATTGRGSLILLTGEAGIGKTRLADTFADEARTRGATVLWGRCWEAGGAPAFWPWLQALRTYLRQPSAALDGVTRVDATQIVRVLPEIRDRFGDLPETAYDDSETARFQLFEALTRLLRAAADAAPIALILDDLHVADEPSLLLLRFVASELADARLLLVGLYRDDEFRADDSAGRLLADLARLRSARLISLRGLTQQDVSAYLERVGGAGGTDLAPALHRQTEGNPLFVAELVRLLAAEGAFATGESTKGRQPGSSPQARAGAPPLVPEGVRAVIGRRLARLSEPCRALLARASAIGVEVDLELLARLEQRPAAELLPVLDEAAAAQLLREPFAPGAPWRFRHSLVRDVLYAALPTSVRTGLHRSIGDALEALHGGDVEPPLAELAHHYVQAAAGGDPTKAIAYSRLAATRASQVYAHEEAVRHLRVALALTTDDAERCGLLIAFGEASTAAGDQAEARAAFLRAADLARRVGLVDDLARAAIGYGGRFAWLRAGDDGRIVPLLEQALAALPPGDSIPRARLLARLAGALRDEPSIERRDTLSREALEMARRLGDPGTLSYAILARWPAIGGPDRTAEMQDLVRELRGTAIGANDRERLADSLWFTLIDVTTSGADATDIHAVMDEYGRVARELRQQSLQWYHGGMQTIHALAEGRLADAEALLVETRRRGEKTQTWDSDVSYRLGLFTLRREQGRLDETVDLMLDAAERFRGYPLFQSIAAFTLASVGRRADAAAALEGVARDGFSALPRDLGWLYGMVLALDAAALLGDRARVAEAARLLEPYSGRFAIASGEEHGGPVDRVLGLAAALEGRLDDAIALLERAAQGACDAGVAVWEHRASLEAAALLLRRDGPGDRALAVQLASAAAAWAPAKGCVVLEADARRLLGEAGEAGEGGGADIAPAPVAGTSRTTLFRREGDVWAVGAGPVVRIRDTKGMHYLATLLANPGREFHALDLAGGGRADPETRAALAQAAGSADAGEPLDPEAKAAYRTRIAELRALIDRAPAGDMDGSVERAHAEIEAITAELSAAYGLGGRARPTASAAERARQSVSKAVTAAIARIAAEDPALGVHLERSVRTGRFCIYDPEPGAAPAWEL